MTDTLQIIVMAESSLSGIDNKTQTKAIIDKIDFNSAYQSQPWYFLKQSY